MVERSSLIALQKNGRDRTLVRLAYTSEMDSNSSFGERVADDLLTIFGFERSVVHSLNVSGMELK